MSCVGNDIELMDYDLLTASFLVRIKYRNTHTREQVINVYSEQKTKHMNARNGGAKVGCCYSMNGQGRMIRNKKEKIVKQHMELNA